MITRHRIAAFMLMLAPLGALPACTSSPAATQDDASAAVVADTPPTDFTFAFTILHQTNRRNVNTIPLERRPVRFVMETDWILRAFSGPNLTDQSFPRETRQLSASDVQSLWTDMRTAGLLDPDHPAIIGTPPPIEQAGPLDGSTWILTIRADTDRRILILPPDQHAAATPLLHRLADLAWMPR